MSISQIISLLGIPITEIKLLKIFTLESGGYTTLVTLRNGLIYRTASDGSVELVGVSSDHD